MKVIVSSAGGGLDAKMDPRFGRCQYFVLVDAETMTAETHANPGGSASGGAGFQAAQFCSDVGAQAVISGSFGPNAFNTLQEAGIRMYPAGGGKIRDLVEALRKGKLREMEGAGPVGH